jgi:hypothetical protein
VFSISGSYHGVAGFDNAGSESVGDVEIPGAASLGGGRARAPRLGPLASVAGDAAGSTAGCDAAAGFGNGRCGAGRGGITSAGRVPVSPARRLAKVSSLRHRHFDGVRHDARRRDALDRTMM